VALRATPLRLLFGLGGLLLLATAPVGARHLAVPEGPVILTAQGRIGQTNREDTADFDRAMLEGLGVTRLVTRTPWTDGSVEFSGIPFERLLEHLEVTGETAVARALNDYEVPIPVADILAKKPLLALAMDGKALSVRDKGPIWVIFPWDQNSDLDDATTKQQSIWQLRTLRFE